jgi:hypothetical protein
MEYLAGRCVGDQALHTTTDEPVDQTAESNLIELVSGGIEGGDEGNDDAFKIDHVCNLLEAGKSRHAILAPGCNGCQFT